MAQEQGRGDPQFEKRNHSPWLMMALIFGGLLLLAILWLRPNRPLQSSPASGSTEVAGQPTAGQVQFENIEVVPSPTPGGAAGNHVVVQADLRNYAGAPIKAVVVEGVFMDENGGAIYRQEQPVTAVEVKGAEAKEASADLSVPLRGVRAVRVTFSAVPTNWNKKEPQLNVKDVQMQPLGKPADD